MGLDQRRRLVSSLVWCVTVLATRDHRNNRVRMVNTPTHHVTTDGLGIGSSLCFPKRLVFDRSRTVAPESALFITTESGAVHRYQIDTKQLTTAMPESIVSLCRDPIVNALDSTMSGHLIFSTSGQALYVFDLTTQQLTLLGDSGHWMGAATSSDLENLVVVESERCAYASDYESNFILRVSIPSFLFDDQ